MYILTLVLDSDEYSGTYEFDNFAAAFKKLRRNVNPWYNKTSEENAELYANESSFFMNDINGDFGHITKKSVSGVKL